MNLRKKIFQPKTYLWVSFILLLTACASTPVKDPIIAGVLEIERHPDTESLEIRRVISDCVIPGCNDHHISFSYTATAPSEQKAYDAVEYYKKELIKIGWRVNKSRPTGVDRVNLQKKYGLNQNYKTDLDIRTIFYIDSGSHNPKLTRKHYVTFNISEYGGSHDRHSKTMKTLIKFYGLSKSNNNKNDQAPLP